MLRLARDIFAHPGISTKRALAFIGYAGFYAAAGTLFASLIAWSMILIVSVGVVLMPSIGRMIDDPGSVLHAGTAVVLGGTALAFMVTGAIGYAVAPFVGAWIGWKSAIAISLVMALVWNRSGTRRYAMHISPAVGALGALLTSPASFGQQGSQSLIWMGIAVSSALSALLVTLIVRSWRDAMIPEFPA
jgi:hypothetical protein